MKITICGSLKFIDEMLEVKRDFENRGHEILLPTSAETGQTKQWWDNLRIEDPNKFVELKMARMIGHFKKIEDSEAILVLNYEKNGVKNYIGGNTLMEIALAFYLGKKIFLWNPIPLEVSYEEEIFGMNPIILNQDLSNVV